MDLGRLQRDIQTSLRLPVTGERRLIGGSVVALGGYALWVGATGAALGFAAKATGQPITFSPWTTTTTVVALLATLLWVLGPAAVGTYLVVGQLTNVNGNLEHHYRVQYPSVLVAVPLVVFGLVAAAGTAFEGVLGPLVAAAVTLGAFVLIRTLAYSYRVFSFSMPRLVQSFLFLANCLLSVALLATAASLAGREQAVVATATWLDGQLGTTTLTTVVSGTSEVGSVAVPTLPALAAVFPVALSLVYVCPQTLAGTITRLRTVTVPRSQLRTGQRYPEFARPTAGRSDGGSPPAQVASGSTGDGTAGTSDPADGVATDASADVGADAATDSGRPSHGSVSSGDPSADSNAGTTAESVNNTRVFTPPDDTAGGGAVPGGSTPDSESTDSKADRTAADGQDDTEGSYRCPDCGERFQAEASFAFCPTCGSELQPE